MANPAAALRSVLRFATRIPLFALLWLASLSGVSADTEDAAIFEMLCEVTSVTADGQPSDSQGIKPGFRARASIPLPPPGAPPTGEASASPNAKGAYWDLEEPFSVHFNDLLGKIGGGSARLSRLRVENAAAGQGSDALEGKSFEYPFSIGNTAVDGFSFVLRDPDGAILDTHQQLPSVIDLSLWPQRACYLDGTNKDTLALVLATGKITFGTMQQPNDRRVLEVAHGDEDDLIAAIEFANLGDPSATTEIALAGTPQPFVFSRPYGFSENALPVIGSRVVMGGPVSFQRWAHATFKFRLAAVGGGGRLVLSDASISGFFANGGGGAIRVDGEGGLDLSNSRLFGNSSNGSGCDIYVDMDAGEDLPPVRIANSHFQGDCSGARIAHTDGTTMLSGNTIENSGGEPALLVNDQTVAAILNLFLDDGSQQVQATQPGDPGPEALCEGSRDLASQGYNIATDASCALDGPGDLPGTDPLLSDPDADGFRTPLPGSPAIDLGPAQLVEIAGAPALPCGWVDITGLGRPQDGDGDGGFECDAGAVEVQGAGAIQAGHSGAFFNSLRNGEGEYVEILEDGRSVIYTFSYNPAGDGAAWLIGVGDVAGNSLVTEDLLRPEGTAWGDDFDTDAIDFADWGGMSMVFPACAMNEAPGNVAFSGNDTFEPLITAAERLTDILGCGGLTPHPNAGLSGSFYDPDRNGEGLVIQYLPDGRVLAIMFTYAPDGEQMWMFGVAEASDKAVTMAVVYPTGFTPWGGDFDPAGVALDDWGTWTLTWTDCDSLEFEYDSSVPGYGSGSRDYTRLTQLLGTQCPAF